MSKKISVFRSPEGEAQYLMAYEVVLKQWPVPYEELFIPTRFGDTHVIASGSKDAAPLALLHPSGGSGVIWVRNVGALSHHYRTFAIDTISEPNKSILTRPINLHHQRQEFADWMSDLFNGLRVKQADIVGNSFGGFLAFNTALYIPERVKESCSYQPGSHFCPNTSLVLALHSSQRHRSCDWFKAYAFECVQMDMAGFSEGRIRCKTAGNLCHHGPPPPLVSHGIQQRRAAQNPNPYAPNDRRP